jgi:hypothetical protein
MHFRFVLAAALLLNLPPESQAAIDETLFEQEEVREFFRELMRAGGNGRRQYERGGFIRLLPNGNYETQMWPFAPTVREATFKGKIPSGTVAIAHTHPREIPHPSLHDQAVAKRLAIPVVVLTPRLITVAEPDGTIRRIQYGQLLR